MSFVTEGPRVFPNACVPIYECMAAFCGQGLRSGCMGPRSLTRTWAWTLWTAKLPVPAELQKPGKALSLIVPRPTRNMLKGLVVRFLGETLVNGRWVFAMWKSYYVIFIDGTKWCKIEAGFFMDCFLFFFPRPSFEPLQLQFPWPKVKAVDAQYNVQPESIESMAARMAGITEQWDATRQTNMISRLTEGIGWNFEMFEVCWQNLLETHLGRGNLTRLVKIPRVWGTTFFDLGWHGCGQTCFGWCITAVNQNRAWWAPKHPETM